MGPPNITEVLSGLSLNLDYEIVSLMQKDSLEMTDADRDAVGQALSETIEDMIVITHGTDAMTNTANLLSDIPEKTIVLTGALSPALFKNYDALSNIGAAFTTVQTKPVGIYTAMNGVIFDHDKVRKDVENNKFVAL